MLPAIESREHQLPQLQRIIIASGGRGGEVAQAFAALGYNVDCLINPSVPLTQQDLQRLSGLRRQFLDPELTFGRAEEVVPGIPLTQPSDVVGFATQTALEKITRAIALMPEETIATHIQVVARDTTQIAVLGGQAHLQLRASEGGKSSQDQAQELKNGDYGMLVTSMVIHGMRHLHPPLDKYVITLYDVFVHDAANHPQLDRSFTLLSPLTHSSINSIILIFRLDELPKNQNCYVNLPGGLDFGHPDVQAGLSFLMPHQGGNTKVGFSTPEIENTGFQDLPQLGKFARYAMLPSQLQAEIQTIRKGSLLPRQIQEIINKQRWIFTD